MDFNATVDLIIKELEEARAIIDDLKNYPGVPHIQLELAKSKCKSAGEVIALLKDHQEKNIIEEKQEPEIKKGDKEVIPEIVEQEEVKSESQPVAREIKREDLQRDINKKQESVIIADRFSTPRENINERLGIKREDDDYADIIKSKPVTNLSDAIGVNDKFLFIREIFDGNPESFEQAITRLNNADSLSSARDILKSYTENKKETMVTRQLLDLVKRKFPADE